MGLFKKVGKILIRPLSWPWKILMKWRRTFYKTGLLYQENFQIPVISVGNVTLGGTGKTPFTIWLCQFLQKIKYGPVVLSRGYKGSLEKSAGLLIGDEKLSYTPEEYGDEALLLLRRLKNIPIIIGRKRRENFKFYSRSLDTDVVVLEDGLQHLQIFRQLDIVLFDCLRSISDYKVVPGGILRESLDVLQDVSAIVLSRADMASEKQKLELKTFLRPYCRKDIVWAEIGYHPTGLYDVYYKKVLSLPLERKKIIAVAALASPQSFFSLIENEGGEIVEKKIYPDHYFFTPEDIVEWHARAEELGAIIVGSEKDIVKIRKLATDKNILFLGIEVKFISGEEELSSLVKNVFS